MIKFYYYPSPNPAKVALYLEEAGLEYEVAPADTRKGEQFTPKPKDYAVHRYDFEAGRHWGIIELRLAKTGYMVGDAYTVVDMALWGWARAAPFIFEPQAWEKFPNIKRLLDEISARPAAERVAALATKHTFKTELDEEAQGHMFPHTKRLATA